MLNNNYTSIAYLPAARSTKSCGILSICLQADFFWAIFAMSIFHKQNTLAIAIKCTQQMKKKLEAARTTNFWKMRTLNVIPELKTFTSIALDLNYSKLLIQKHVS